MKLMDLASRLGLSDSISFIGYIDEKKKIGLIARADAFVIPSLSEGYGLNAIYAKVLDVPTVATNTGNHKEILSGSEKALIIKPGDSGQLTEAIISLLGKKNSMNRSPDLMALDNYDIENTAREYIKIFEQVLAYS
jgi:glycosyltransferase involved in cell wall biosynthesis